MATTAENFFIQGESSNSGYLNVRDLSHHEDTRKFVTSLWAKYELLADDHFR